MSAPKGPGAKKPDAPAKVRGEASTFVVDANAWIKLHEQQYPPDLFPSLWNELRVHCQNGRVKVPREVVREVGEADGVGLWIKQIKPSILLNPAPPTIELAKELQAQYPALTEKGHSSADSWIIASAKVNGWVVVSEESSGAPHKLKMPDVSTIVGVDYFKTLEMLRALGIKICRTCIEK